MPDREKVIKGLEMHEKKSTAGVGCLECPYAEAEGGTDDWCIRGLHRDTLALLKEQEPVEPIRQWDDDETTWWYSCGSCEQAVDYKDKYCRHCGMRLIDADALAKLLSLEANAYRNNGDYARAKGIANALWAIAHAPTVSGWISVKDRMPEIGYPYFAACRSLTNNRENWVIEGVYGIVTHDKPWGVSLITLGMAEVYAWMPKIYPEPPKEDADEH